MNITMARSIANELRMESQKTRKLFERIPVADLDWKPHAKSMTIRQLASHIAESFTWIEPMLDDDVFEMDPATYTPWIAGSVEELLSALERNVDDAAERLEPVSDARMLGNWTMRVGGKTVITSPRASVVKVFALGHHIHHRGQLDVYLRLRDVPLPHIYGPTADEPDMVPSAS